MKLKILTSVSPSVLESLLEINRSCLAKYEQVDAERLRVEIGDTTGLSLAFISENIIWAYVTSVPVEHVPVDILAADPQLQMSGQLYLLRMGIAEGQNDEGGKMYRLVIETLKKQARERGFPTLAMHVPQDVSRYMQEYLSATYVRTPGQMAPAAIGVLYDYLEFDLTNDGSAGAAVPATPTAPSGGAKAEVHPPQDVT